MCVTDHHDVTLAVKVALNPNTTNQRIQAHYQKRGSSVARTQYPWITSQTLSHVRTISFLQVKEPGLFLDPGGLLGKMDIFMDP